MINSRKIPSGNIAFEISHWTPFYRTCIFGVKPFATQLILPSIKESVKRFYGKRYAYAKGCIQNYRCRRNYDCSKTVNRTYGQHKYGKSCRKINILKFYHETSHSFT